MLKTIYKNCAGIDVHKKNIVVRIAKTDEHDVTNYQLKTFSTFTEDLIKCRGWLVDNDTFDVCMESTGKKQSVRIIKAGQYIKPLLVECALNAIKDKSCPYIKARYESIKKRRGHKKAIIAIARFLLTCAFHILKDSVPFDNDRFDKLLNQKIKKHNQSINNTDDMISYLTKLGYTITQNN